MLIAMDSSMLCFINLPDRACATWLVMNIFTVAVAAILEGPPCGAIFKCTWSTGICMDLYNLHAPACIDAFQWPQ